MVANQELERVAWYILVEGGEKITPKFRFSGPTDQSLIQPFMEPFELNLNKKEPFKKPIPAHAETYFNP